MQEYNWLPHLNNEMMEGARNNNLCSYLIALEGWRRGLTLTWYSDKVKRRGIHSPGRLFSLSNGSEKHLFYKSKGDKVSDEAVRIGTNKSLTKEVLSKKGIPVPKGSFFSNEDTDEEILEYSKKLTYPLVLKPKVGNQGKGVIANIQSQKDLKEALLFLRADQNNNDIILEEYFEGEEYRFFIIEDKVLAILNRIPANIIGDGIHPISKLINLKNNERKKNPRLYSCLIKEDYETKRIMKRDGLTLDYIPKKGEQIFLSEKSNISAGGDSIDVTDEIPETFKNVAINALSAVPKLPHAGLDMIINLKEKKAVVLEINPIPQIGSLVFPMQGQARDIPSSLIDYYFPETRDKIDKCSKVYFDFKGILQPLYNKSAKEIVVIPAPQESLIAKKYIVEGAVKKASHKRWIRKKAIENDLYGFVEDGKSGNVAIVVAGREQAINDFLQDCKKGYPQSNIEFISEKDWNNPVKACFEIKASPVKKEIHKNIQSAEIVNYKKKNKLLKGKSKIKKILKLKK